VVPSEREQFSSIRVRDILHSQNLVNQKDQGGMMRKTNIYLIIAAALLVGLIRNPVAQVSAGAGAPVGVVVAYTPGQSITIVDQSGTEQEYVISSNLKILPPGAADSLAVGSFVTIIAPASVSDGKQMAVGIVVHPQVPPGWSIPALTTTVFPSATPVGTEMASPTGTLPTVTATLSETPTPIEPGTPTETPSMTPVVILTETATPTPTPAGGGATTTGNSFIDWLRSILKQLVPNS
jgi:hypothetical protein